MRKIGTRRIGMDREQENEPRSGALSMSSREVGLSMLGGSLRDADGLRPGVAREFSERAILADGADWARFGRGEGRGVLPSLAEDTKRTEGSTIGLSLRAEVMVGRRERRAAGLAGVRGT